SDRRATMDPRSGNSSNCLTSPHGGSAMAGDSSRHGTQDVPTRRTRREMLTGAAAATAGAVGAVALTRPTTAYAGTDGDVVLGHFNTETAPTEISNTINGDIAFSASCPGFGSVGVKGTGYTGVYGQSGATASSTTPLRNGVHGLSDSSSDAAVWGENVGGGPGVLGGQSGSTGDGVEGRTDSAANSGVYAHN